MLSIPRLLLCLALPLPALAAQDPLFVAGQLRSSAQQAAKLALQRRLEADPQPAELRLQQQLAGAREALASLAASPPAGVKKRTLERAQRHWSELLGVLAPSARPGLEEPGLLAEQASQAAGALAMELSLQRVDDNRGNLADLALRQGMLAQRMARLYLLRRAGGPAGGLTVDWEQTRREFAAARQNLRDAPETTPAVRQHLDLADTQWVFFEQAMERSAAGASTKPEDLRNVITTSDRLAETMTEAARLLAPSASVARAGN